MLLGLALVVAASPVMAADEKAPPEFEYYQVPAMLLPVITDKGLTQQIGISVSLETPYGQKDAVAEYAPRLVDAYIRDLFGAVGSGQIMMKGNVVDTEKLKARLSKVTQNVLGDKKDMVKNVYLQAVQQHGI
jgi:hypothetical protein